MVKILADDLHVLTGSYALDALPDPERAEFERHLQHCPSCDAEVRGLRETAARLAMARALQPPPGMEQRVLAAAYRTRQLPPLPTADHQRRAQVSRLFAGRPGRIPGGWPPSPPPPAWPRPSLSASRRCPLSTSSSRRGRATPRSAGSSRPPTPGSRRPGRSAGGSVTVVASAALREAVVTATGMVSPPAGRVYQVWVMSPSGARSAGLMAGPSTLLASAVVPGDRIGITVEPAGGTSKPTTTPVAVLPA